MYPIKEKIKEGLEIFLHKVLILLCRSSLQLEFLDSLGFRSDRTLNPGVKDKTFSHFTFNAYLESKRNAGVTKRGRGSGGNMNTHSHPFYSAIFYVLIVL